MSWWPTHSCDAGEMIIHFLLELAAKVVILAVDAFLMDAFKAKDAFLGKVRSRFRVGK